MKSKTFFIALGIMAFLSLGIFLLYANGVIHFLPNNNETQQNNSPVAQSPFIQDNSSVEILAKIQELENKIIGIEEQINSTIDIAPEKKKNPAPSEPSTFNLDSGLPVQEENNSTGIQVVKKECVLYTIFENWNCEN